MKQQSDWFTGIDYYEQYQEKNISVELLYLDHDIELHRHVQVEIWYVIDGEASIIINGETYAMRKDSFICMYAHHLYAIKQIEKPITAYVARFYIGVFMHMMWEKHQKGINAQLVYDTCPHLICDDAQIKQTMIMLFEEQKQPRFGSKNMMLYLVLQVHTLYCRTALKQDQKPQEDIIWKNIKRIIVSSHITTDITAIAKETGYHPQYLNQLVKKRSGYTFQDLLLFGKVINACALLHFDDLSIAYIIDLLQFENKASFYRTFEKYTKQTPLAYRKQQIYSDGMCLYQDLYLQIQQYLNLHFFQKINVNDIAKALQVKPHAITHILQSEYQTTFTKELQHVRICYACALLRATNLTMTQIAMDCGFESVATFQRAFHQEKGCTSSKYRNLSK